MKRNWKKVTVFPAPVSSLCVCVVATVTEVSWEIKWLLANEVPLV